MIFITQTELESEGIEITRNWLRRSRARGGPGKSGALNKWKNGGPSNITEILKFVSKNFFFKQNRKKKLILKQKAKKTVNVGREKIYFM